VSLEEEAGITVPVLIAESVLVAVDFPEDIAKVEAVLKGRIHG
jgi:CMP-2-keto-3-deoxyoctulosonic acid synthetase